MFKMSFFFLAHPVECDGDGNEDGSRNGDDMIKTKHYLNNIIEMISKLSNVIAITTIIHTM